MNSLSKLLLSPCTNAVSQNVSALRCLVAAPLSTAHTLRRSARSVENKAQTKRALRSKTVIIPCRRVLRSDQSGCPAVRLAYGNKGVEVETNNGFTSKLVQLVNGNDMNVLPAKRTVKTKMTSSIQPEAVPEPVVLEEIPSEDVIVISPVQGQSLSEFPAPPASLSVANTSALNPRSLSCGLPNIGNSCYMNSAIQALAAIPSFVKQVFKTDSSSSNVLSAFKSLFEEMGHCSNEKKTPSIAKLIEFKRKLSASISLCRNTEQQDCEEFVSSLLRCTSTEVIESFRGKIANEITCSLCAHQSSKIEPFVVLNLPMASDSSCSVNELLKEFQKPEKIYDYRCPSCSRTGGCSKAQRIQEFPDNLIIQLKRFEFDLYGRARKIKTSIKTPINLDENLKLAATIQHIGNTIYQGHYIASRPVQNKWCEYDDHVVNQKDSRSGEDYILFYTK